jgi:hypothetical protein
MKGEGGSPLTPKGGILYGIFSFGLANYIDYRVKIQESRSQLTLKH